MLVLLNVIFFVLALGFTILLFLKSFEDRKDQLGDVSSLFWFLFAISMIFDAIVIPFIMQDKVVASKIYIYEEENKKINTEIQELKGVMEELQTLLTNSYAQSVEEIKSYIESQSDSTINMHSTSNEGTMDLTMQYYLKSPDIFIDLDTIYAQKIEQYNYNCKRISVLKEKKINARIFKYLLYFGW